MIIQGEFKVLSNKKVGPDYFRMEICAPGIVKQAKPGQFVHLRCQNSQEPLLRRPFSFHRLNQNNFEILYKIVGRGTNLLPKKQKGDTINVLGPLGNGFDIKKPATEGSPEQKRGETRNQRPKEVPSKSEGKPEIILVAGGMGVAPLLALAEKLADKKDILVLIGARNRKELLCAKDFKKLGAKVKLATDDGSLGCKGFVTDLLRKVLLSSVNCELSTIYACGPNPMLKEIARIVKSLRISAYGSLEENMACGVGACLGCAIRTKEGYKRVCKDGPIFNLKEIEW